MQVFKLAGFAGWLSLTVVVSTHAGIVPGARYEYDASNTSVGHTNVLWKNTGTDGSTDDLNMSDVTRFPVSSPGSTIDFAYSLNSPGDGDGGQRSGGGALPINRSTGGTIETWIRRDLSELSTNTFEILAEFGGNRGYSLLLSPTTLTALSTNDGTRADLDITSLNDSDFMHLAAVWDDTTDPDQLVLYAKAIAGGAATTSVNSTGTFDSGIGTGSGSAVFNLAAQTALLDATDGADEGHLGGNLQLSGESLDFFRGEMAVLRVYDFGLTASQVQNNFNTMIPEPTTLLIWSLLAGLGVGLGWRRRK